MRQDIIFNEIKQQQQHVTGYQKAVTGYNIEKSVSTELESAKTTPIKARFEENMRGSTRQRSLPPRLQDYEMF